MLPIVREMTHQRMSRLRDPKRGWRSEVVVLCLMLYAPAMGWTAEAAQVSPPTATQPGTGTASLAGGPAMDETVFPGLATRISLDLRGMDIVEVLKFLSSKGNFNIVTGSDVQGRATLTLTDVTVRDALDIVLVSNGLAVERRGNILYVLSGQTFEQLYGHRYGDPRQSLVIQLQYANPAQVGTLLGNLKSPVGRIVVDEATATIAMLDTPTVLAQMQALIAHVDISTIQRQLPTETHVVTLQFADAEKVKPELDSLLTPEVGSAKLDKRSNALIVTDMPAKLSRIEQVIKAFDARHRQVYIEATILQVTLKDNFDTGIDWQWLSVNNNSLPNLTFMQSLPISSDVSNPMQLKLSTLKGDVTATIKALYAFGKTEILSSPNLSVMNNEEAKILVGRREAYVTSTVTQAQSTATTAESVQFVDVGVKLYVTPTISESGFVTMKIRPEVSSKVDTLKTTSSTVPIIETSEAETRVMVKDGVTLVIGGLMKEERTKSTQKVPVVGDLPLIGALFRNTSDRIQKTELVILITPHIISGEETVKPAAPSEQLSSTSARKP